MSKRVALLRLWPTLRPHRFVLLAATGCSVVASSTTIIISLLVARIIDGPVAHRDMGAAVLPVLGVLLAGVLEAAAMWGRRYMIAAPATQIEVTLRAAIFAKLQAMSIGAHDAWDSGQLLSRAVEDLSTLRRFVGFVGPYVLINASMLIGGTAVLIGLNWQIGLVQLAIGLPLTALCTWFVHRHAVISRRAQDQTGDLATLAEESVQGIRVIKAFGRGPFFTSRFTTVARQLTGTEMSRVGLEARLWAAMASLPELPIAFAVGYGGYAVATGSASLGTVVAAVTLATYLQMPIVWTGFLLADTNQARTAADRYFEIMDTPVAVVDTPNAVPLPERIVGELRLDHVRFSFGGVVSSDLQAVASGGVVSSDLQAVASGGDPVLTDVSLTVRPGETVALVGATGVGKTALLTLIPRLYNVDAGRITVDGADIADWRLSDLRSVVAVAFEDPVLFSASVRENVTLGAPEATDGDVRHALKIAEAEAFVDELPWGLDTRIGDQGMSLSGGQRQRLALARVVLSTLCDTRTRIVVLDDPLSALDVATEERVQAQLREVLADTTTLLVAHRPSTAALADRVALLSDGRIVAEGSHEHLLTTNADYRDLMGGVR